MVTKEELGRKYISEARSFAEDYVEGASPRELLRHMELYQLVFILFLGMTLISLFIALFAGFDIAAMIASLTQLLCIIISLKYSTHGNSSRNILVFLLVVTLMFAMLAFVGNDVWTSLEKYYVFNPYVFVTFYGFTIFFFKLLVERQVEYELYLELLKKSGGMQEKGWFAAAKDGLLNLIDRLLMP
jgi:hypothetical protein